MPSILDWSTTAASNGSSDSGINWQELQNPDTVNDSARAMMGRIAEWRDDKTAAGRVSTGSAGAYVITSASSPDTLLDGFIIWFLPNHTNSGAATLKVNSFPAKPLRGKLNTALAGGEVVTDVPTGAMYSSTNDEFLLLNSAFPVVNSGQEIAGAYNSGLRIGDVVLTLDTTAKSGRIRLTETTQTFDPVAYPELSEWLIAQSSPWGANTLPSAAGYFLRFAANDATVDPDGPRTAGSTQSDALGSHAHGAGTLGGTTNSVNHNHTIPTGVNGTTTVTGQLYHATGTAPNINTGNDSHSHTLNINGSTALNGGDETRGKNIAMHADIIASTSEANSDVYGVNGIPYQFDSGTTDADPGSGQLRLNNATLASVTEMYISETGKFGEDFGPFIATWDDVSTSTVRATIKFFKVGAPENHAIYSVTGTNTDNGSYDTISLTHVTSGGSFADGDELSLQVSRTGAQGASGPSGGGIGYTWDTGTTDADPGSGDIRGNNATLSSITELYISTTDSNGADETTYIDSWDDSGSTIKGSLQIIESATPSNFLLFHVTAVTTATGYRKISVTYRSGNGTFDAADALSITFVQTGDKGDTGAAGANGTDGTDPGYLYTFSTTTTDADPGAGYLRANNASLASATAIYIDDADRNANNHEAAILGWDDSTNATARGQLLISTPSDGAQVIFNITGASTDNAGYTALAVTYVSGATSFANDASISVQFVPAGNDGAGSVNSVNGDTGTVIISELLDTNGVDAMLVGTTASAVNEVTVTNAATGNAPSLTATGDDTNIDLNLAGKGAGVVNAGGNPVSTAAAAITDNAVVRGDGGAAGLQESGITIDDSDNVAGVVNMTMTGYIDGATNHAGLDNIVINNQFSVWQLGDVFGTTITSASTIVNNDDAYITDRWLLLSDGNDIVDVSKETTTVPDDSYSAIKLDVETANKRAGICQIIENRNAEIIIGGVASLQFKARAGGSNTTVDALRYIVASWSSTADTVTSDIVSTWSTEGNNPTLATNWTIEGSGTVSLTSSYQTFTAENISIDTVSTKNVAVFIMIENDDGTVGDLVYITDIKLESGAAATAFAHRPYGLEVLLCQRYLVVYGNDGSTSAAQCASGYCFSGTLTGMNFAFPAPMRITPSVSLTAASGNLVVYVSSSAGTTRTATLSTTYMTAVGGRSNVSIPAGGVAGDGASLNINATTAGAIYFDAEL